MMHQATLASPPRGVLYPTAAFSLVAGLVQLRAVPQHFEEWWAYGAFFLLAALAQSLYGTVLLLWPNVRVLLAGMAGNSSMVLTYHFTRSSEMEKAGDIGALDLLTTVSGTAIVAALGYLLLSQLHYDRRAVALVPVLGAVFALIYLPQVLLVARLIPA